MINIENHETENYYMEGFAVATPQPFLLEVSAGSFNEIKKKQEPIRAEKTLEDGSVEIYTNFVEIEEIERKEYPAFSFMVEPDDLVDVMYDVSLIEQPSITGQLIHVDRTEMDGFVFPQYNGEDVLLYTLMSFIVPPGATDLKEVKINLHQAVRVNAESNSQ